MNKVQGRKIIGEIIGKVMEIIKTKDDSKILVVEFIRNDRMLDIFSRMDVRKRKKESMITIFWPEQLNILVSFY